MTAKRQNLAKNEQSITIPYNWSCRPHQQSVWDYMIDNDGRGKRAVMVWHRRAGKDSVCLNIMAYLAHRRVGLYYYFAPTQAQCRRVVWDNIDDNGRKPIDQAFPHAIRERTNNQEMRIELKNGSIIQVLGSDNYDSVVGSNPLGMVFTEWSIATKPQAWSFFKKILAAKNNNGWAMFPFTPRGLNHGYHLYRMADGNPNWFCQVSTVLDTRDNEGERLVTDEAIQQERDEGEKEHIIQQEYFCNFTESNERQVFHMQSVLECMSRDPGPEDVGAACIVGVDCARFGDDSSVIATRIGRDFKTIPLVKIQGRLDTKQLAYQIQLHCEKYNPDAVFVDVTGQGIGVFDELRSRRVQNIVGINFQEADDNKEKYANIRCGMMARFALWCEEPDTCLHADDDLRTEMSVTDYDEEPDPHGRLKIISKKKIKTLLEGHSPDALDACVLTFARPVVRKDVRNFRGRHSNNRTNQRQAKVWSR